jgi:glutamate carboxypeptidase
LKLSFRLLKALRGREQEMTETLRRLVLAESPSKDKAAADRCARLLAAEWRRHGARVEYLRRKRHGDHVRATWEKVPGRQVLVLGHYDTVYARGAHSVNEHVILRALPERAVLLAALLASL